MKLAETERSEEKLGEQILLLMYENILNQYKRNETTMQAAFLNGTYNCVSASVIFMALAKAANLNTTGQITPNHAFCTLKTENKTIDVETTNPYGFNPGTKNSCRQQTILSNMPLFLQDITGQEKKPVTECL